MNRKTLTSIVLAGALIANAAPAWSESLYIYPNNGQDQAQQDQDRYQCHAWAVDQTGFDPTTAGLDLPDAPDTGREKGGRLKSAAGGAILGTAIGAIAGKDIGESAAIGAGAGVVGSGLRARRQSKSEQEAYQNTIEQQQAALAADRAGYDRALIACLEGRGYTVK